jgi:drug/metabolite transporter (DMT)-like permease
VTERPKRRSGWRGFVYAGLVWLVGAGFVAFASVPAAIAWLIVGAIYVGGEVWVDRHGQEHPKFTVWWWLAWRIIFGLGLIALGAAYLHWTSVPLFLFGAWSLALAALVFARIWRERQQDSSDNAPV